MNELPAPVIPPETEDTIREKIVEYIMQIISGMKQYGAIIDPDLPDTADNREIIGPLFQNVYRGDPDDMNLQPINAPLVCVEDGDEERVNDYTQEVTAKRMVVYIHVRFVRGQQGVEPFKVFNYYLGRLQSLILLDYRLGGNCQDVNETGSGPQVFNGDSLQGGHLSLAVSYRHVRHNPFIQR